jgi:site-specific DNA-methyltransferase (adenine-specific)
MIEPNGIFCGDCNTVLQQVKDESIDLTIFSPPYDKIRDYKGFSIDLTTLGKNLYRVSKIGAVCAVVITDATDQGKKSLTTFRLAVDWVDNAGWRMFEHCIYARDGRPGKWWSTRFRVDHEYILLFVKGDKPKSFDKEPLKVPTKHAGTVWHGTQRNTNGELVDTQEVIKVAATKCRGTIWKYATSNTEGNKLKMTHPGTFPDRLADDLIVCFSQENDVVLDPTVGSGTTAVMAANRKRRYIGMDISPDYVKIAQERLAREVTKDMLEEQNV